MVGGIAISFWQTGASPCCLTCSHNYSRFRGCEVDLGPPVRLDCRSSCSPKQYGPSSVVFIFEEGRTPQHEGGRVVCRWPIAAMSRARRFWPGDIGPGFVTPGTTKRRSASVKKWLKVRSALPMCEVNKWFFSPGDPCEQPRVNEQSFKNRSGDS